MTVTTHLLYGSTRSILLGAGTCYALETGKYWHLPIIFIIPSTYAGYQLYKHRDDIKHYISSNAEVKHPRGGA
jgi:hypothetical protein